MARYRNLTDAEWDHVADLYPAMTDAYIDRAERVVAVTLTEHDGPPRHLRLPIHFTTTEE